MGAANLSLWREEGVQDWPARPTLDAIAATTGRPYREVLEAALFDTGYAAHPSPGEPTRSYRDVLTDAIRVLTEAAHLTESSRPAARSLRTPIPIDWAVFVCQALAGAAANAGGVDAVLSGRQISWAASTIRRVLNVTVGHDESALWQHRTEPLRVVIWPKQILADIGSAWFDDEHLDNRELARVKAKGDETFEQTRAQLDERRRAIIADYSDRIANTVRATLENTLENLQVPIMVTVADEQDIATTLECLECTVGLRLPQVVEAAIRAAASTVPDPGALPGTPLSRLMAEQQK